MLQNNMDGTLEEAKFNQLCAHYKDTYDIHVSIIKQRDTIFYILLAILALFALQVTSTELVNSTLSVYVNKQLDISIDKHSNLFGTLLWFLLFGFSTRYYQTVVQIERQYIYIHHLEEVISRNYPATMVFTREGKSYSYKYPIFSNWIWLLYTLAFPMLLLLCIIIRMMGELVNYESLGISILPGFITYLLVGASTILYIGNLHYTSFINVITKYTEGIRKLSCRS